MVKTKLYSKYRYTFLKFQTVQYLTTNYISRSLDGEQLYHKSELKFKDMILSSASRSCGEPIYAIPPASGPG